MKIRNRKQILFSVLDPGFTLGILAFRAMPVSTGVVANADVPACIAFVHMTTQNRSTAMPYGIQSTKHIAIGSMPGCKLIPEPGYGLCQFISRLQSL
jgi:hypothetical protein